METESEKMQERKMLVNLANLGNAQLCSPGSSDENCTMWGSGSSGRQHPHLHHQDVVSVRISELSPKHKAWVSIGHSVCCSDVCGAGRRGFRIHVIQAPESSRIS